VLLAIEASHAVKTPRTGVEEACWQMIKNLSDLGGPASGGKSTLPADTRVILYSHKMPDDKSMSVHVYGHKFNELPTNWEWKILNWPVKKLWSQFRLSYELFKNPPDVFFAVGQLLPFFLPKKIKVITFVHDSAFEAEPNAYSLLGKIYLKLMNRRIVARSDKIITSTEFNKKELLKYYQVASEKVVVVPLAYDANVFCMDLSSREARRRSNLSFDQQRDCCTSLAMINKPYFIYLGRLEEKKNTALLVRAFDQTRASGVDCQLVLVGKFGKLSADVRTALVDSPYKKDIIVPGYVKSEDLPGLMCGALALVFPSRYEGFGMPILESMACGTPVIVSDIPALREVGGSAITYICPKIADLALAMAQAAKDPVWRENHRLAGLERVKSYSWTKTAEILGREIAKTRLF